MSGKSPAFIGLITCVFALISGCCFKEAGSDTPSFADRANAHSTHLRDARWMELARNSLATQTYEDASSMYGCLGECLHEKYGFANAMLIAATSEEQCLYPSFERLEHQNGCRAYLRALRREVEELRQWVKTPASLFLCIDEEALFQHVTELHELSTKHRSLKL